MTFYHLYCQALVILPRMTQYNPKMSPRIKRDDLRMTQDGHLRGLQINDYELWL